MCCIAPVSHCATDGSLIAQPLLSTLQIQIHPFILQPGPDSHLLVEQRLHVYNSLPHTPHRHFAHPVSQHSKKFLQIHVFDIFLPRGLRWNSHCQEPIGSVPDLIWNRLFMFFIKTCQLAITVLIANWQVFIKNFLHVPQRPLCSLASFMFFNLLYVSHKTCQLAITIVIANWEVFMKNINDIKKKMEDAKEHKGRWRT